MGEELNPRGATIGGGKALTAIRNSNISWIRRNIMPSVEKVITPIVQEVSDKQSWGYIINKEFPFTSSQYTTYDVGGYYKWHKDNNVPGNIMSFKRVISTSLLLNENFTGGEFELSDSDDKILLGKGDIIIFKSNLLHRVKSITSGQRKSLVIWFLTK